MSARLANVPVALQTGAVSDETAEHYDVSLALPRNPGAVALARDFAATQLVKAGYLGRHD